MAIKTKVSPRRREDTFLGKDRDEVDRIVRNMRRAYVDQLHEATFRYHQAQRQANRAAHEQHRIERHLERINAFCKQHNIPVTDEEKG